MYTRTRTIKQKVYIEQTIYTYQDLLEDEDIKQKVLNKWIFIPAGEDEWEDSWKEFEKSLPHCILEDEEITGLRLRTWIINNYYPEIEQGKYYSKYINGRHKSRRSNCQVKISPFTGFYGDMVCIDPILNFVKEPNDCDTWGDLLRQCRDSWERGFERDMEWQQSEEYILESIQANEYEFDEEGNII